MRYKTLGKPGFAVGILLSAIFFMISFFFWEGYPTVGRLGICLPSPNEWTINPISSRIANGVLLFGTGISLAFFNRVYSFVKSTDYVLPVVFLLLVFSNPWINTVLNSSSIMAAVTILCLWIMFPAYKRENASIEVFLVATFISLGSMFQYAFLSLIPAFLGVGLTLKCLRFREIIAFIIGIIAPYWTGIGLGLILLSSFSMPSFENLFNNFSDKTDLFLLLVNIGVVSVVSFLLALNNAVVLYAGNSRIRAMNNSFNIVSLCCCVCMIFDFTNFLTYFSVIYMGAAVQTANLFALFNFRKGWIVMAVLAALLIAFFIAVFINFK